jgi:hypothetical protein
MVYVLRYSIKNIDWYFTNKLIAGANYFRNYSEHKPLPMARRTEDIVQRWLRLMKVPVSANYLKQKLLAHPDHPSVAAITDTLDELGIDNATIEVDKEKYNELPFPFMAAANGGFRLFENRENFLRNCLKMVNQISICE